MRILLAVIFIWLTPSLVIAEDTDRSRQADEVKKAVKQIVASKKTKVHIVLNDLREFEGKIDGVYEDSFRITFKQTKKTRFTSIIGTSPYMNSKRSTFIKYYDVLQLEGKGVLLSFVPDPKKSPYSSWEELKCLPPGEFLQVHLTNGKKTYGTFFRYFDDKIVLLHGNTESGISRENIVRLYRVTGDATTLANKAFQRAQEGAEITDDIFSILDPLVRIFPPVAIVGVVGAVVYTVIYVLPKDGTTRVLAFAK